MPRAYPQIASGPLDAKARPDLAWPRLACVGFAKPMNGWTGQHCIIDLLPMSDHLLVGAGGTARIQADRLPSVPRSSPSGDQDTLLHFAGGHEYSPHGTRYVTQCCRTNIVHWKWIMVNQPCAELDLDKSQCLKDGVGPGPSDWPVISAT